ncbi:hypothetical protein PGO_124070 [Plasmodium gonderi]|uniref:Uncharacterized protein n=1 Tax=Plasmodium gonderi TaxID=77519 RepID=A0A1Y1JIU1_PLAGO|nr:hypothetical protein PGO_124070 [Plasmodium gonderi]GAW82409.1 hypothetical protein PGO_124070 [Plasmodium gonderi]
MGSHPSMEAKKSKKKKKKKIITTFFFYFYFFFIFTSFSFLLLFHFYFFFLFTSFSFLLLFHFYFFFIFTSFSFLLLFHLLLFPFYFFFIFTSFSFLLLSSSFFFSLPLPRCLFPPLLETYESKVCVANSIHDISSPTSENEENTEGSYSDETVNYNKNKKTFNLLSYIENGIKNYINLLKEENVEIYERKCIKEIITFHKLKLKYLKKKKKSLQQNTNVQNSEPGYGSPTFHSTSEEDKEEIIKNFDRFNSLTSGKSDENSDIVTIAHKKDIYKKKNKSNNNIDTKNKSHKTMKSLTKQSNGEKKNNHPTNSTLINKKKKEIHRNSEELDSLYKSYITTLNVTQMTHELNKVTNATQEKRESELTNNDIDIKKEYPDALNVDIDAQNVNQERGEGEANKNIFEAIFHFYIKDKEKETRKQKSELEMKKSDGDEASCATKGMDIESFLNFAKHYKIIKSLLTKSELEKIFLNESKGNPYIQAKHFQKVLMTCAQIAFTKPPHKVNFTDTKKIYNSLILWLSNNSPEQQKKIISKNFPLTHSSSSWENSKTTESQKFDSKNTAFRNKQYSISVKDKNKKKKTNDIALMNSQKLDISSKKSEKPKLFRYNTNLNLRK